MIDTIDGQVLRTVADTLAPNLDPKVDVHTVTVTLNGAHGGVDVTAEWAAGPNLDAGAKTWEVS